MKWLREIARRLKTLWRGDAFDAELREEMRLHVDLRREEQISRGVVADEARYAAQRRFGNMTSAGERSRGAWGWEWLQNLGQDIRFGLRMLRKSPAFSAVAILTIALGIGATTAIFSVVDATLLHPLPYPQAEQLVRIEDDLPGVGSADVGMSVPEWKDFERSGIFQYISPIGGGDVNLTGASEPTRIRFLNISPNYFATLDVRPELGRTFDPTDPTPGFNLEVVISDGLWKRAFGSDPGILGKSLRLDNDAYHVVGVMPPEFRDPGRTPDERKNEIWAASGFAAAPAPLPIRSGRVLQTAIARMAPGLTIEAAQSRVDALVAALQKQFPGDYPVQSAWKVRLVPLKESVVGNIRQSLILMLGAVGLVLLIGCVNIANLLLTRASARTRELGVRQALGAARKRLVAQMLTENLLLSAIGGVVGTGVLYAARGALLRIVPESLQGLNEISVNSGVLIFAVGASLAAGVIFGVAPAFQAGRVDLIQVLRQEGRSSTGSAAQTRMRRALVVAEFALSVVLLIAAGLLLRSFSELLRVRPGFNPESVTAVRTWLPVPNDPSTDIYGSPAKESPFLREVLRRGAALPGVQEIAIGNLAAFPMGHGWRDLNPLPLIIEGHETSTADAPLISRAGVTPGYFHLLGLTLLKGRVFTDFDDENAPAVIVINETMARKFWPSGDAVGGHIRMPVPGNSTAFAWAAVVGEVADARTESLAEASIPEMYVCLFQRRVKDLAIFVRGHVDAAAFPAQLREQVQAIDPELPVFGAETLGDAAERSMIARKFSLQIVGLFAVTALLLAALGIYGVISYMVSERRQEIGIRVALGAQRGSILKMVLRQGMGLAIAGAALGLVCAAIVARLMAGLLFGVRPGDPLTFGGVAVILLAVAAGACLIPAMRAVRVDPMIALRAE